jgi:hypothetical protein
MSASFFGFSMAALSRLSHSSALAHLAAPVELNGTKFSWDISTKPKNRRTVLRIASRMIGTAFKRLDDLKLQKIDSNDPSYKTITGLIQILFQRKTHIEKKWNRNLDVRAKA